MNWDRPKYPQELWEEAEARADAFQFTGDFETDYNGISSLRTGQLVRRPGTNLPLQREQVIPLMREEVSSHRGAVALLKTEVSEKEAKGHDLSDQKEHAAFLEKKADLLEKFIKRYSGEATK